MLGVFKSVNNGITFQASNTGLTSSWIQCFTFCNGKIFAGSGEEGIFVSANNGSNWNPVNTGLGCMNITALASDGTYLFAGTSDSGIYCSSNFGSSWYQVNNGLADNRITALQYFNGHVLAGTGSEGVFKSSDNGNTWISASDGMPAQTEIRALHACNDTLLAGTDLGEIYFSSDYGESWLPINDGLYGSPVLSICCYDENFYTGINGTGLWKRPCLEITGLENQAAPSYFSVFPNPATNSIRIESPVIISKVHIVNTKGQIVKKMIVNDYHLEMNIKNLISGLYTLQIYSSSELLTQRIIILN
jgi:hypothetical protein